MSKESLGFDVQKEMEHLKSIVEKDERLTISSRFVKYLIEQAERVEASEYLAEHHLKMLKYCSDARRKYYGIIKQLYEFDGDVQEHSKLADMLCGDVLEGELHE